MMLDALHSLIFQTLTSLDYDNDDDDDYDDDGDGYDNGDVNGPQKRAALRQASQQFARRLWLNLVKIVSAEWRSLSRIHSTKV